MNSTASFQLFEQRAADYAKHRPRYPAAMVDHVVAALDLEPTAAVADIGSGTGIFTRLLLERKLRVHAVEPSDGMRRAAEADLADAPGFVSVAGRADATGLPPASVDAIVCAQAFHWFNHPRTVAEWRRILRPGGQAALVWNFIDDRQPFARAYLEVLLATHPSARGTIESALSMPANNVLFSPGRSSVVTFSHEQVLDLDSLIGRTRSLSFAPRPEEPAFADMAARHRAIFDAHQVNGWVRLAYRTVAIYGPIT